MDAQQEYDDAMFEFTQGNYDVAIERLRALLEKEPAHFDAQLSLGMAHYRKGDYENAIIEGHKAEKLRPHEQFVHTNLSLFYMKKGDKQTAEHHGLQARIASWREEAKAGGPAAVAAKENPDLAMAKPKPPTVFPEQPWKKKKPNA